MGQAGRIGLMVTGLAVGVATGNPALGLAVGTAAGSILFPDKPPQIEGPRLGDLSVSGSTYGTPIPIGFGGIRQGGNMIWSTGLRETRHVQRSGGKGGAPRQTNISYTYSASFALSFGEGPATAVLRIWADGKLVYDRGLSGRPQMREAGLNFRFYPGTEDQGQDPAIVADKGADRTPAYRGQVLLVFENIQLGKYGNRIPNVTAEIGYAAQEGSDFSLGVPLPTGVDVFQTGTGYVDFERGFAYTIGQDPAFDGNNNPDRWFLRKYSIIPSVREIQQIRSTTSLNQGNEFAVFFSTYNGMIAHNGDILMTIRDGVAAGNSKPIVRIDGQTLQEKSRFGVGGSGFNYRFDRFEQTARMAPISLFAQNGMEHFVLCGSQFNSLGVLDISGNDKLDFIWSSDDWDFSGSSWVFVDGLPDFRVTSVCGGLIGESFGEGYATAIQDTPGSLSLGPFRVYRITVRKSFKISKFSGLQVNTDAGLSEFLTLNPGDLFPGETETRGIWNILYDKTDNSVIFYAVGNSADDRRWFKFNQQGQMVWRSDPVVITSSAAFENLGTNAIIEDGVFGYASGLSRVLIDTQTGALLVNAPNVAGSGEGFHGAGQAFSSRSESVVGVGSNEGGSSVAMKAHYFRKGLGLAESIGTIIKRVSARVGLEESDLNTSAVDALTVPGYLLARQMAARGAITPLAHVFLFDGFESDGQLKFTPRGQDPVRTITQIELAPRGENGSFMDVTRVQEVELPKRVTLHYLDQENDYLENAHHVKRIQQPTPVMHSDHEMNIEFPGALSALTAKQQAEKIMFATWAERMKYGYNLPWSHLDLDPGDIITILLTNGVRFQTRLQTLEVGQNLELAVQSVGDSDGLYISFAEAFAGEGVPEQLVQTSVWVLGKILDIPLLRDMDEPPGRVANPVYVLMGTAQEGLFQSGSLLKSPNGIDFDPVAYLVSEMAWGTTINALGDPNPSQLWSWDEEHTVTVHLTSGHADLVSMTEDEILQGLNAAAIMKPNGEVEVIQYQNVTENPDGTYTLSRLLRGRRGTDTMAFGHTANQVFILLRPQDIEIFALTLEERGVPRFYRSVGANQFIEQSEMQTLISEHRALKPYAVAQIKAEPGSADAVDISWVRRTRIGGALQDDFGDVPLNEDDEEYEIEIFDAPGGSVVRTVTGLTDPEYEYTAAQQVADGFTAMVDTVTLKVYQISAQVGRGFAREVTLNVE